MNKFCFISVFAVLFTTVCRAQFAPAAGYAGSTAIHKDSAIFVAWATDCSVQRGYQDLAVPDSGYVSVGDGSAAVGVAGLNGIVSLGDGGVATLTFAQPIYNGPGFDFAVFENGFYTQSPLAFLEFAFVEVSSDGSNFFRFPATSNIQDTTQIPMTGVDCSLVNNLAGKYVFSYGTPFDLEELSSETGLDLNHITHIRLIDVVGSIDESYASRDQYGTKINDPYPTQFPSGGFDLDAVGVIHQTSVNGLGKLSTSAFTFQIYPNPATGSTVELITNEYGFNTEVRIYDAVGNLLAGSVVVNGAGQLDVQHLKPGIYFIVSRGNTGKLIVE